VKEFFKVMLTLEKNILNGQANLTWTVQATHIGQLTLSDDKTFGDKTIHRLNNDLWTHFKNDFSYTSVDESEKKPTFHKEVFSRYKVHLVINAQGLQVDSHVIKSVQQLIEKEIPSVFSVELNGMKEDALVKKVRRDKNSLKLIDNCQSIRAYSIIQPTQFYHSTLNHSDLNNAIRLLKSEIELNNYKDNRLELKQYLIGKLKSFEVRKPQERNSLLGSISSSLTDKDITYRANYEDWKKYGEKWLNDLESDQSLETVLQQIADDLLEFTSVSGKLKNTASSNFFGKYFFEQPKIEETLREDKIKAKFIQSVVLPMIENLYRYYNVQNHELLNIEKVASESLDEHHRTNQYIAYDFCKRVTYRWNSCINQYTGMGLTYNQKLDKSPEVTFNLPNKKLDNGVWYADALSVPLNRNNFLQDFSFKA